MRDFGHLQERLGWAPRRRTAFNGASLGTKWSDPDKRWTFFGTFAY